MSSEGPSVPLESVSPLQGCIMDLPHELFQNIIGHLIAPVASRQTRLHPALRARSVNRTFDREICRSLFLHHRHIFQAAGYSGKGETMSKRHLFLWFQAEMQLTTSICRQPCLLHEGRRKCYNKRNVRFLQVVRGAVDLLVQRSASLPRTISNTHSLSATGWAQEYISTDTPESLDRLMARSVAAAMITCLDVRKVVYCLRTWTYRNQQQHGIDTYEVGILTATFLGDLFLLRTLLQEFSKRDVKVFKEALQKSLLLACQLGCVEIARELISFGANADRDGLTEVRAHYDSPLEGAVWWGQVDMVRFLLDQEPGLQRISTSSAAFERAVVLVPSDWRTETHNDKEIVSLLLHHCTVRDRIDLKYRLLQQACRFGQVHIVNLLLDHGLDPTHTSYHDSQVPPFHYAVLFGRTDTVAVLLDHITSSPIVPRAQYHQPDACCIVLALEYSYQNIASKIFDRLGNHRMLNDVLDLAVKEENLEALKFGLTQEIAISNDKMRSLTKDSVDKNWSLGLCALTEQIEQP